MAQPWCLHHSKYSLRPITFKLALLFCGVVLVYIFTEFTSVTFHSFGYVSVFYVNSSFTLNSRTLVFTKNEELDSLSKFASSCGPVDLTKLLKTVVPNGTFAVRLVNSAKTTRCPRKLREASYTFPRTWLISNPGSGNTWARHLLQQLTGIPTGAVYSDGMLRKHGFPYENRTDHVIAIKAHSIYDIGRKKLIQLNATTDRLILLIRNPYSAFLADFKRGRMNLKHKGNALISPDSATWQKYLSVKVPKWKKVIRNSLQSEMEKMVVFYEDLTLQLLYELIRLATFLTNDSLEDFALCCTLHRREGRHHRPASRQAEKDVYSNDHKKMINSMLMEVAGKVSDEHPIVAKRLSSYVLPL